MQSFSYTSHRSSHNSPFPITIDKTLSSCEVSNLYNFHHCLQTLADKSELKLHPNIKINCLFEWKCWDGWLCNLRTNRWIIEQSRIITSAVCACTIQQRTYLLIGWAGITNGSYSYLQTSGFPCVIGFHTCSNSHVMSCDVMWLLYRPFRVVWLWLIDWLI